jgi:hypothetical protein
MHLADGDCLLARVHRHIGLHTVMHAAGAGSARAAELELAGCCRILTSTESEGVVDAVMIPRRLVAGRLREAQAPAAWCCGGDPPCPFQHTALTEGKKHVLLSSSVGTRVADGVDPQPHHWCRHSCGVYQCVTVTAVTQRSDVICAGKCGCRFCVASVTRALRQRRCASDELAAISEMAYWRCSLVNNGSIHFEVYWDCPK